MINLIANNFAHYVTRYHLKKVYSCTMSEMVGKTLLTYTLLNYHSQNHPHSNSAAVVVNHVIPHPTKVVSKVRKPGFFGKVQGRKLFDLNSSNACQQQQFLTGTPMYQKDLQPSTTLASR